MPPYPVQSRELRIQADEVSLHGELLRPRGDFHALVLFVHRYGAGRHSKLGRLLAQRLARERTATLLLDLLTPAELEASRRQGPHGVDLPLLTSRVQVAAAWATSDGETRHALLGLCASGVGAAAAFITAARLGREVAALVCLNGRPDLAGPAVVAAVNAPTLLLVGSDDAKAVTRNDAAYQHLRCERSLAVVPQAGPTFEEAGVLAHAVDKATDWFSAHFAALLQQPA